jgi:hypothetical protein
VAPTGGVGWDGAAAAELVFDGAVVELTGFT